MSSFTVPATWPVPLTATGAPDVIRAETLRTIQWRDNFIFSTNRRMLVSTPPFATTSATYVPCAALYVHNSLITRGTVTVAAMGDNVDIGISLDGVSTVLNLIGSGAYDIQSFNPTWTNNTWALLSILVKTTSTSGFHTGVYLLEDPLIDTDLP